MNLLFFYRLPMPFLSILAPTSNMAEGNSYAGLYDI